MVIYGYRANGGKRLGWLSLVAYVSRNETFQEFFNWTDLSVYKERKGEGANDNDGVTASGANHRLIVGKSES